MTQPQWARKPREETLSEFGDYQELLAEAGRGVVELDDALIVAEQRQAARDARRRNSGMTADAVGRGRA